MRDTATCRSGKFNSSMLDETCTRIPRCLGCPLFPFPVLIRCFSVLTTVDRTATRVAYVGMIRIINNTLPFSTATGAGCYVFDAAAVWPAPALLPPLRAAAAATSVPAAAAAAVSVTAAPAAHVSPPASSALPCSPTT